MHQFQFHSGTGRVLRCRRRPCHLFRHPSNGVVSHELKMVGKLQPPSPQLSSSSTRPPSAASFEASVIFQCFFLSSTASSLFLPSLCSKWRSQEQTLPGPRPLGKKARPLMTRLLIPAVEGTHLRHHPLPPFSRRPRALSFQGVPLFVVSSVKFQRPL